MTSQVVTEEFQSLVWTRDPVTGDFSDANNNDWWRANRFYEAWPNHEASFRAIGKGDPSGLLDHWATKWLYPFEAENGFLGHNYCAWARKHWWLPFILSFVYCVLVLKVGPSAMKNREPLNWSRALTAWNLILAVFSFMGMVRTLPHLFALLYSQGWSGVLCTSADLNYGNGPSGLWVMLFIHSKYFEFIDTFFLIIRKKKVGLLHWYHHASVLVYCWDALMWQTPAGILFSAMNYSVHSVMYFYYFLTSLKIFPRWAHWITKIQILQMVIGVAAVISHLVYRRMYKNCDGAKENLYFAGVIYWSYFMLFANFYLERYGLKEKFLRICGYEPEVTKKTE